MKVFFGIKYFGDNRRQQLVENITALLSRNGFEIVNVIKDVENWGKFSLPPRELMAKTFELIDDCDIVLIELSKKGVGLGIEAGYAFAKNKTVITIANRKMTISKTLEGISMATFNYESLDELSQFLDEMSNILKERKTT